MSAACHARIAWPLAWCCPPSEQQQAWPAAAAQCLVHGVPAVSNPQDNFRAAVLAALGSAPEDLEYGRLHRFSVNGKPSDTAGWCHLFDDGRAGVYGDFRTGLSSVWTATRPDLMTPAQRADLARRLLQDKARRQQGQQAEWAAEAPKLARLWAQCRELVSGDPVSLYLRRRLALAAGVRLEVPRVLRLHPGLEYHHEGKPAGRWPAMVAAVTSPAGELVALHRTWLTPEGRKAPTPGPVKKLSRTAGRVMGGCIRLAWPGLDADPAGAAGGGVGGAACGADRAQAPAGLLGIAEGIETALAARQASGAPTVAAYSAGALAAWRWPPGLNRLVIFADHDPAGTAAADKLRQRARAAGLSVNVMRPTTPGTDWCDVWAQRGSVCTTASEAAA